MLVGQMSSSDRSLVNAFKEIANMGEKINLPRSLLDRANSLFKEVRVHPAVYSAGPTPSSKR